MGESIGIRSLLLAISAGEDMGEDDPKSELEWYRYGKSDLFRHQSDIFQVQDLASGGCGLCSMIWTAFDRKAALSPAWSPDKDEIRGPLTKRGWTT